MGKSVSLVSSLSLEPLLALPLSSHSPPPSSAFSKRSGSLVISIFSPVPFSGLSCVGFHHVLFSCSQRREDNAWNTRTELTWRAL